MLRQYELPRAIAIACFVLSTGCLTTSYQKMGFKGGFQETKIDANTFKVSFSGNAFTSREIVETFLLYRCAELTVEAGFDGFVTQTSDTDKRTSQTVIPGYYDKDGKYHPGTSSTSNWYTATATIRTFKGPKPESDANAYDAREILQNLGPRVKKR